jgi:hypothetical protein
MRSSIIGYIVDVKAQPCVHIKLGGKWASNQEFDRFLHQTGRLRPIEMLRYQY